MRIGAARAAGAVLVANLLFGGLLLAAVPDRALIASRIHTAFTTGALDDADYASGDSRRGWHQYNDCLVLQMLLHTETAPLAWALAPRVYEDASGRYSQCGLLRALVAGTPPADLTSFRYGRYWHGYNGIASLALGAMDLARFRTVLSATVWAAVGLLAVAAFRATPRVRKTAFAIAAAGASLWALPYFAPNLTHGPGDAVLLLGLAGLAARPSLAGSPAALVPYAAAFGAVVTFLEMMTGQLPTAVAWLIALTLAAARDQNRAGRPSAPSMALAAALAFGGGAVATIVIKQVSTVFLVESGAASQFVGQLGYYMSVPDFEPGWPGLLEPFGRLVRKSSGLTFGAAVPGYAVVAAIVALALAAGRLAWRHWGTDEAIDRVMLLGASLIPAAWVLLLPLHTYIHAAFMVRMLVVPIALLPLALYWPAGVTVGTPRSGVETRFDAAQP